MYVYHSVSEKEREREIAYVVENLLLLSLYSSGNVSLKSIELAFPKNELNGIKVRNNN